MNLNKKRNVMSALLAIVSLTVSSGTQAGMFDKRTIRFDKVGLVCSLAVEQRRQIVDWVDMPGGMAPDTGFVLLSAGLIDQWKGADAKDKDGKTVEAFLAKHGLRFRMNGQREGQWVLNDATALVQKIRWSLDDLDAGQNFLTIIQVGYKGADQVVGQIDFYVDPCHPLGTAAPCLDGVLVGRAERHSHQPADADKDESKNDNGPTAKPPAKQHQAESVPFAEPPKPVSPSTPSDKQKLYPLVITNLNKQRVVIFQLHAQAPNGKYEFYRELKLPPGSLLSVPLDSGSYKLLGDPATKLAPGEVITLDTEGGRPIRGGKISEFKVTPGRPIAPRVVTIVSPNAQPADGGGELDVE